MRCKLTKYGLFSVTLMLLIVFGCRQDDFYVSTDQQPQLKQRSQDINIRSISFQDFKMKLNDMRNRPNVEEFISESGHGSDWIIYTDEIKEITRGDYTSYTLYLQTSDTKEHNFYNLTIEEKGENTYVFVTKYSASGEWDKNVETFQGEIIAYRIPFDPSTGGIKLTVCCGDMNDGGGGGSSAPPQSSPEYPYDCEGYVVTTIIELPYQCSCDGHWPWQSCECWGNLPGYVSINQYTCVPYSDLPDPSEGNPGNPGGGGSGTGGSPNPPADLTYADDSITTPVKPQKDKNRDALKNMVAQGQYVQPSLSTLESKTNDTKEWGYALKYPTVNGTPIYVSNTVIQASYATPNILDMFAYIGGDYVGVFHTHPNPTLTNIVPMFSPEDVRYLAMVAAKHNTNGQPKDYSVYVITLTVPSGTYALKIEDPVKFFGFMNTKYGEFKDYLQDTYDISGNQASSSVLINDLLKVLQKYNVGVALYKANEDYSDWFKQGF